MNAAFSRRHVLVREGSSSAPDCRRRQPRRVATNETCLDWTSGADNPNIDARIGHSNRTGLAGQRQLWNDVHSVGCSQSGANNVTQGGGRGSFYCFAVINGE